MTGRLTRSVGLRARARGVGDYDGWSNTSSTVLPGWVDVDYLVNTVGAVQVAAWQADGTLVVECPA